MIKIKFFYLGFLLVAILLGCSTVITGPVDNKIDNAKGVVSGTPLQYIDPLGEIETIQKSLEKYRSSLNESIKVGNKKQERYFSYIEALDSKIIEQEELEDQLNQKGEIELLPGKSYHFNLVSFCVHGKAPRPVIGDGFRLNEMEGPAKKYLPEMLKKYSTLSISHNEMQGLIWALIAGLKFDELNNENKSILRLFYPDAEIRFGNRATQDAVISVIGVLVPDKIQSQIEKLDDLKSEVQKYQDNFEELESVMSPIINRPAIAMGWIKTEEGYFIKSSSKNGYSQISIEIYVPNDLDLNEKKLPQSKKTISFFPWKYVALPGSGQRFAVSSKVIKSKIKVDLTSSSGLKNWRPTKCHELSDRHRSEIISKSGPMNFPNTRYSSPPDDSKSIEEETDCSHFTHEIYHRIGIDFPYTPTVLMKCLYNFKEISNTEARPGDLILYNGHIGIYTGNQQVVSATRGAKDKNFHSSIKTYPINTFGKGRFLKWSCR